MDDSTAEASKVGQLSVTLQGTNFGVDVNPAADALRVVGDQGQNLRFSFSAGTTTVDGTLTYPPATMPVAGVSAAAYTNNDLDPNTATTLFDLDASLDQIAIQAPANSGQLSATGKLTIDAGPNAGFDIYSEINGGTTVDVQGFATLAVNGTYRLYEINILTGKATDRGGYFRNIEVFDLALPLDQ